ncbi:MAG: hypothetical protein KDC44_17405 [Phaeodactylibacter sp.]|nr:hypothetical protein [Phaeodactylibacter sp.]
MKPIFLSIWMLAWCFAPALMAQPASGVLRFTSEGARTCNAACWFNGDLLFIEVYRSQGDTIRRIVDRSKEEVITLIEQEGETLAVKMNDRMSRYLQKVGDIQKIDKSAAGYECDLLTEKKEIGEQVCMKVTAKGKDYSGVAWMDHELPRTLNWILPYVFFDNVHIIHYIDSPGFPMQWSQQELRTKEKASWKVRVSLQFEAVNATYFMIQTDARLVDFTNTRELMEQTKRDPRAIIQIKQMLQSIDGE